MGKIALSELSDYLAKSGLDNELVGEPDLVIFAVNTLEDAQEGEISFLANSKYVDRLGKTSASAVLVGRSDEAPAGISVIRSDEPYKALCMTIIKVHGHRRHPQWGVSERADIRESAQVGPDANIAPGVTVSENVRIGKKVTIYPGCYIGDDAVLGDDVTLYPNVVIYDESVLGSRVTIHAGSVIGEDGLGYAPVGPKWIKIPQVGRAVIYDDVDVGANCTIDRATLGQTMIGSGSKFSNLIAIGHGTKIGSDCMIVAQVGIAGSTTVGRHVTIAGQAGIVGHIEIGDDATVAAQAGVTANIEPGVTVLNSPAAPIADARRQMIAVQRLPDLLKQFRALEAEVKALKATIEASAATKTTNS